jgi:hypothetical protein
MILDQLSPYLCRVSKLLPFTGFGRIAERRWLIEPTQYNGE